MTIKKTKKPKKKKPAPRSHGDLYKLLDKSFPQFRARQGKLSIRHIAVGLDIHTQSVSKWCLLDRVPANQVKKLVELSNGKLTVEQLQPFFL